MKKIFVMLAAVVMVMMLNAAPANAASGGVSANEFWSPLGGMTQAGFQSWANVTPISQGTVSGTGGTEKWVDYPAYNGTYTRNITSVSIHFTKFGDGSWGITNPPNKPYGGKWEISPVSPYNYDYGVNCTSAC